MLQDFCVILSKMFFLNCVLLYDIHIKYIIEKNAFILPLQEHPGIRREYKGRHDKNKNKVENIGLRHLRGSSHGLSQGRLRVLR